MNVLSVVGD